MDKKIKKIIQNTIATKIKKQGMTIYRTKLRSWPKLQGWEVKSLKG
jgi:hypothetical protein